MINRNILLTALFFILGCSQVLAGDINWIRDLNQAKQIAKAQGKPMLIDFYTDWCGWCKRLDKDTYANNKVIEFAKKFICVKMNADEHPQIAKQYSVRGFPSTVFLKADGILIEVVPGYMPADEFLKLMEKVIANLSG